MPINERRRDDIATAVAAYDRDHPDAPLPRNATQLLAFMFPSEDVCQRDPASKSDQRTGTPDQEDSKLLQAPAGDPNSPLERALARFAAAVAGKKSIEQEAGG